MSDEPDAFTMAIALGGMENDVFNAMGASVQAYPDNDVSNIAAIACAYALKRWLYSRCPAETRDQIRDTVVSVITTPVAINEEQQQDAEQGNAAG